jgi:hypothetical protein
MHKETRNMYRISVAKPEVQRPLGRPKLSWEENIKLDLKEMGYGSVNWINLTESCEHSST